MIDNVNTTCTKRPERKASSEKSCEVIKSHSGPFMACHEKVLHSLKAKLNLSINMPQIDPTPFYDICVRDTCGCDAGDGCHCNCDAIAHYAHACGQIRIPVEWRSNALCRKFKITFPLYIKHKTTYIYTYIS